jgi:DNA polymerase-3 subunit chi
VTRISFLHGAADRIQSAAQWLHQTWNERHSTPGSFSSILVYVPDADNATRLDRILWTQPPLSFLPHCRTDSPLASATPILLTASLDDASPVTDCLLNLGNALPEIYARFEHLVEIVSIDDEDRLPARERFKFYRDRGYAVDSRDIGGSL